MPQEAEQPFTDPGLLLLNILYKYPNFKLGELSLQVHYTWVKNVFVII